MKTICSTALLLALLSGLTGQVNKSVVHVYSSSDYAYQPPTSRHDLAKLKESYAKLPLSFVANDGQADKKIKFTSRGSGYSLALAPTTFTVAASRASVVQATLFGGNKAADLTGVERLLTSTNYLIGNDPRNWKTNVPSYAKVKYSNVYSGVDLIFYGNQDQLEYDFTVSPGVDHGVIALGFQGITNLRVDEKGDLILRTDAGEIRQSRPVVYQQVANAKRIIPAGYLVKDKNQIAFQIAAYDRTKPLVIDPTLAFSTFLGGSGNDRGAGIAVDSAGNAYITGATFSTNFPVTPGAFDINKTTTDSDVFVVKMNSTGTALIYSTFFGGDNRDSGNDIAIDVAGNAYVTGQTDSSNIPITPGAFRTMPVGTDEFDAFAFKLNATGTALVYSTYLGPVIGSANAVDSSGNAYITGQANGDYPTTPGAFQTTPGGSSDAFVTKQLNSSGTALVYSTFLGGSGFDIADDIAIDSAGNAYVTGSAEDGFPVTAGAFQTSFGGSGDAFVTKLNATGSALVYSTYLGGSGSDTGNGIAINAAGNAYVTGVSASSNFPTTAGAFQTTKAVGQDAFVTELNAAGNALVYSTYLGGDGNDFGNKIALDATGNASVVGLTGSTDFPTTADAIQSGYGGNFDAFITRRNAAGTGARSQQGCLLVLDNNQPGKRVMAHLNHCNNIGHAVIQIESGKKKTTFVVNDKDTSDTDCTSN